MNRRARELIGYLLSTCSERVMEKLQRKRIEVRNGKPVVWDEKDQDYYTLEGQIAYYEDLPSDASTFEEEGSMEEEEVDPIDVDEQGTEFNPINADEDGSRYNPIEVE